MVAPDGPSPAAVAAPGHDNIEWGTPPAQQPQLEKQQSSSSSGRATGAAMDDDKHVPLPAQEYAADPEKQSEMVGSLDVDESGPERSPLQAFWLRHWKKVAQLITLMLFTALVTHFSRPPLVDIHAAMF